MLLLAATVWGAYQFRLGQLRARFQAVLKERNRLAREMHDTLIQGCASVSALLEAHSSLDAAQARANDSDLLTARARNCAPPLRKPGRRCGACAAFRAHDRHRFHAGAISREQFSREFAVPVEYRVSGTPFALRSSRRA